ncbi:hypothetical protein HQ305_06780 [Rhodococcus sp. BP-149]|uniref:hypothetical protein n=1 Tax=unclassified Rhodococcus (in: high G+C Gram-positive bacteria) TaxID=192944 RepID=UPI001C9AFCF2|nr:MULTISPECIES: hypothetical protein [unclassified Rhodococcus (in: high G+C Gram-positive bacteria)]MBY6683991.1 hypothetical protein [Rhodococcus sp. BP-288]MBY6693348.1 hypothetical protein [Rhodococcus sp. BP-188]MBY6697545.1 hypothetical protein [Rhodococcus sp. BP-285]MBY6702222.1 hypothetical protein [Rhodococcus sp. BP-283]MBY6709845.1 hypothetical protein [Rhodococcus sp. BP-160]
MIAAIAVPLALAAPGSVSAAEPSDITYSYDVVGDTVTNTITNTADGTVLCTTGLAAAPEGVLPPVETVLSQTHEYYDTGSIEPGTTATQTVTNIPPGSYVVLATCTLGEFDSTEAWWLSDYPGIKEHVENLVPWTTYTVQQASVVITIDKAAPEPVLPAIGDLADAFGS